MGEIANYFAKERYIKARLSVVVLTGTLVLVPIVLAAIHGKISQHALEGTFALYAICIGIAIALILRAARAKFPHVVDFDGEQLDPVTQRKLRRRILFLQCAAAVYAVALAFGLAHGHTGAWLPVIIGAVINLLIVVALLKAIRRLKMKLKLAERLSAVIRAH